MEQALIWYLPTFHGDIKLEREGPKKTLLRAYELTPMERLAMEKLRSSAVKKTLARRTSWANEKDFIPLTSATYNSIDGVTIHLNAEIEKVQTVLAKALKPSRKLLTAVRFTDGRIEELHSIRDPEVTRQKQPYRDPPVSVPVPPVPAVAVTVAVPVVGCPMPEFQEADVRASRVLEAFLDPDQIDDYRRHGAFITRGADTGNRYMVANRERPNILVKCGGRQLYDMEMGVPLCVHDWEVPPAEEMLALHLLLCTPGNELKLRGLPEVI